MTSRRGLLVISVDEDDWSIRGWSSACTVLTGIKRGDAIGQSLVSVVSEPCRGECVRDVLCS